MGNVTARFTGDFVINVRTGDRKGAGTDANIFAELQDENGYWTYPIKLSSLFRNDHERNSSGNYYIPKVDGFSRPVNFRIWRDRYGPADDWYLESVTIYERQGGAVMAVFPILRWIKADKKYVFRIYDCHLPQNEEFINQRTEELLEKKLLFEYTQNLEGAPVQIKTLPPGEIVTNHTKAVKDLKMKWESKFITMTSVPWTSLSDLKTIYKLGFPEPTCVARWNDDVWFGYQRLQGLNPMSLELCMEIPSSFGAGEEELGSFLEGYSLEDVIARRKLFIVDHSILRNLPCKDDKMIVAPIGLFYLNEKNDLVPIAIQLFPNKSPDNPVFLPTDSPYTWMLAKMFFNHADATIHRSWLSFGRTHLLNESIWVCTNRNLSPSHPVFRLLAPHFPFVMQVNASIMEKMMAPGGWIDRCLSCGMRGFTSIIGREFHNFRMDKHFNIPAFIESRGLTPDVIPQYPFRDDAALIYKAIRSYVEKVISFHYDTPKKIKDDMELKEWRQELQKGRRQGGCDIRGIPGEFHGFVSAEELTETVTGIIANCTLLHSAVNIAQYDECSFPPNYPTLLRGNILRDKNVQTEKNIVDRLPTKEVTISFLSTMRSLSAKPPRTLGHLDVKYLYHPNDVKAQQEFLEDLKQVSEIIKQRNITRRFSYTWLDPETIPNYIAV